MKSKKGSWLVLIGNINISMGVWHNSMVGFNNVSFINKELVN